MADSGSSGRLAGLTALVTGAASGLGRAIATACAAEGARVFCADINAAGARDVAAQIRAAGHAGVDVTDEDAVQACVGQAQQVLGQVDTLVNAAGIVLGGTATDMRRADWDRIIAVNLTGPWLMCRAVLPGMIARQSGSIITIASMSSLVATPANVAYTASKGGVAMLTKSIALDYAAYNIRANAICPGTVPTDMVLRHYREKGDTSAPAQERKLAASRARYPLNRHGTPEEIAALAVYLAAPRESGFMTGALLPIDGGVSAAGWLPGQ